MGSCYRITGRAATSKVLIIGLVLGLLIPSVLWAQSALENPSPGGIVSGINIVSGWKCTAGVVTFTIDNGAPNPVIYGASRGDTASLCKDDGMNGFITIFNWNLAGAGVHTIRLFDNGVQFAQAVFGVVSTGQEFLTGLTGQATAQNFPAAGIDTYLAWQEALQNFVIVGGGPHVPTGGGGGGGSGNCLELFITDKSLLGEWIKLSDSSVWAVAGIDQFKLATWITSQKVLLCQLSTDILNTRTLINLASGGSNVVHVSPL